MANVKNLIATDGTDRIVWNSDLGHLETGEPNQSLLLTSRPYFTIKDIKLSPNNNFLALSGDNGVTIVEMPRKWGGRFRSEKGSQIYCKTYNINERLFTCDKRIRIVHAAWHPCYSDNEQVLCILTNDNRLRMHDVITDVEVQSVNLKITKQDDGDEDDDEVGNICSGFSMLNICESAVCFDFGPPMTIQDSEVTFPIYILLGSGDILLIYSNFRNPTWADHIIGPLKMLPQAEDNYGSDACSLIVMDSSPPMLALATPTGHIYHCFAFADKQTLLPRQTLYVYECIELGKDLIENQDETYSQHVIKLFKDPTSDIRYFCVHQNGIHTIVLPILESLQSQCDITQEKESFAEFLICTRTSTPSDANESIIGLSTPKGIGVEIRQANILLLVLMNDNELIKQKISPAATLITRKRLGRQSTLNASRESNDLDILNVSQIDAARSNFVEQIELILKRKTSVPVLKLSPDLEQSDKLDELMRGIVGTFKEEYIKKYNLAVEAIKKKFSILERDLKNQKAEFESIQKRKDDIYSNILVLHSKDQMVQEDQTKIMCRLELLLGSLGADGNLSEAEQKLKREMHSVKEKLYEFRKQFDTIVAKHKYNMDQKEPVYKKASKDLILSQPQLNLIKDTLARQGADIADLKRIVKSTVST